MDRLKLVYIRVSTWRCSICIDMKRGTDKCACVYVGTYQRTPRRTYRPRPPPSHASTNRRTKVDRNSVIRSLRVRAFDACVCAHRHYAFIRQSGRHTFPRTSIYRSVRRDGSMISALSALSFCLSLTGRIDSVLLFHR